MSRTSTASSSPPSEPPSVPHGAAAVAARLAELGVRPSRRFGQSFLVDPFIADAEAAIVAGGRTGPVLEIGGGLGVLTQALLRRGLGPLTVIEHDPRLVKHLRAVFGERVHVVEADAVTAPWPPGATVVGNLPFSVGTSLLERVWRDGVARFVGMHQREVVDRLESPPGSRTYGRLTIAAALFGEVEAYQVVPSRSFEPAPEVEGRVFEFRARPGPPPVPSVEDFERLLAGLFSARRKQLKNLVGRVLPPGMDPGPIAQEAGWPVDWPRRRPEELPPEAFFRFATARAARVQLPAPERRSAR